MTDSATPAALIFDLDGTLADTMPAHYEAWNATMQTYGLELSEDRFYALGGWPTRTIVDLLIAETEQHHLDAAKISAEKEIAFARLLPLTQPIEPVVAIARAHVGKLPLAIGTGATREIADRILNQIGLADWFPVRVCSEDVPTHKPEPDIFLEAARRLKVPPTLCRVYEDANPGIEAARRAGMECVDVRQFFTPRRVTAQTSTGA